MILLKIVSWSGLVLTVGPAFLVFNGLMEFDAYKKWVLLGTLLWFTTAPFWINRSGKTAEK